MIITQLTIQDIPAVVTLHQRCLPTTTSSLFGKDYLLHLYQTIYQHAARHLLYVAKEKEAVIGVITVSLDLKKTQSVMRQALFPKEIPTILRGMLRGTIPIGKFFSQMKIKNTLIAQYPDPYTEILTLFVDATYRRKGIAHKLISHAQSELIKRHIHNLYVDTEVMNKSAQSFYVSAGFIKQAVIEDAMIFSKPLKK